MTKKKTRGFTIWLPFGKAKQEKYLAALRNRYASPKSGWSRLIARALHEIIAIEEQEPAHGAPTT